MSIRKQRGPDMARSGQRLPDRPVSATVPWWVSPACAAISGLLLFLSDAPLRWWPLQAVAFLPLLWALSVRCHSMRGAALSGLCFSLVYVAPSVYVVELPFLMALGFGAYQILLYTVMVCVLYRMLGIPGLLGALSAAAAATLVVWLDISLLPIWGTAQCFTRVLTAFPPAIQFLAFTGVSGLVFVLIAGQVLLMSLLTRREGRRAVSIGLVLLLSGVVGSNIGFWHRKADGSIRVATVGWTMEDLENGFQTPADRVMVTLYEPLLEKAAAKGASLVVSPEVGLRLTSVNRARITGRLKALARAYQLWLFVGVFDETTMDNRILFVDPEGQVKGQYRKTHLIPLMERYVAGDGTTVTEKADNVTIGGMICQDDNFTDIARAYGKEGVEVMVVPTNDWKSVKDHHLENSLFRAIENQYGLVRAASNGISLIAGPRGEVLARKDHFEEGPGVLVADMPIMRGVTFYSRGGAWFVGVCLLLVAISSLTRRLSGRSRS